MTYDTKCHALAEHFLSDYMVINNRVAAADTLAQSIQDAIESHLQAMVADGQIREFS